MTYSVESKNQLAKLLATENLTIEHRKVSTASFDMKNRVLTCPIWKDMTGDLYDLFMGHEVGHALETPLEGWHDNVSSKGKNYKHFLNVVEDARIEKKMKRRYPGLKRSFVSAYNRLMDDDFFGVLYRDLNKLSLIDKINIHFKCGVKTGIKFTDEEMAFVKRVESCETWDDVVEITDKLFDYCKGEQLNQQNEKRPLSDDFNSDEYSEQQEFDSEETDDSGDSGESEETGESDESEETEESEDSNEDESKKIVSEKESSETDVNQFEPRCETDENFRKNEMSLLDASCLPYVYLNIPKANIEHIVTPQQRVQEILTKEFKTLDRKNNLAEFKRKNQNYVGLLAKEFEMRKAATRYAKRKISSTGDIDVNKIYKYQLEDSIFRKITKVPNGKSHGLILLLDCSGSMHRSINGAIEQIMVLAMFCRRVNIPFVVYGFGNNLRSWNCDYPDKASKPRISFEKTPNNLSLNNVCLREYLNSEMSNVEFNNALSNLATLKKIYEEDITVLIPVSEHLSNTPLTESIIAMKTVAENFRNTRKLDIVNLVIVHDGDADYIGKYIKKDGLESTIDYRSNNYIFVDEQNKVQFQYDYKSHGNTGVRIAIFDWFTRVTGIKIFGFFIVPDSGYNVKRAIYNYYYIEDKTFGSYHEKPNKHYSIFDSIVMNEKMKEFRKNKLLISKNPGYEKFFLILGGKSLVTDFDDLDVEEGATMRKLKSAFTKKYNHRKTNRVLVNQFIEGIAS